MRKFASLSSLLLLEDHSMTSQLPWTGLRPNDMNPPESCCKLLQKVIWKERECLFTTRGDKLSSFSHTHHNPYLLFQRREGRRRPEGEMRKKRAQFWKITLIEI